MYKMPHFTEKDNSKIIAFMQQYPFAIVTGFGEHYPVATHIPLEVIRKDDGTILLCGHLMKNSDHHKAFVKNSSVLVIFNGPHCYVSADWYSNPQSASTWNYMTVHAKGNIVFTDKEGTHAAIKAITNKYEGTATAAAFDAMPKDYIDKMLNAIIGFTITVATIDNVFKLSQNKTTEEQKNIIEQLQKSGDAESLKIAGEMEKLIGLN
jgi:transcriptional regulator